MESMNLGKWGLNMCLHIQTVREWGGARSTGSVSENLNYALCTDVSP